MTVRGLDALTWLDLASFLLSRHGSLEQYGLAPDDFAAWRREVSPDWADELGDVVQVRTAAEAELGDEDWTLGSLTRAATGLLSEGGGLRWPPSNSKHATLARWRLPPGVLLSAAHAFSATDVDRALAVGPASDEPIADMHVHVGALLPYDVLFELVVRRLRCGAVELHADPTGTFVDACGEVFDPRGGLAAAALLAQAIDGYLASDALAEGRGFASYLGSCDLPPIVIDAILAGRTWRHMCVCVGGGAVGGVDTPRFANSSAYVDAAVASSGSPSSMVADLDGIIRRDATWIVHGRNDTVLGRAVVDYFRVKCIVHSALTQGRNAGLLRFLESAVNLKSLRDWGLSDKRDLVRIGMTGLHRQTRLVHAELRTSEQAGPDRTTVERSFAASLAAQFDGYGAYVDGHDDGHVTASWPLCLTKAKPHTARVGALGVGTEANVHVPSSRLSVLGGSIVRFAVEDLALAADAAAASICSVDDAERVITGFDVAGDEEALPNWLFALLFASLADRLGACGRDITGAFRVHAGEEFASGLAGIRRVHEAAVRVVPKHARPRIGHALAVYCVGWRPANLKPQPFDEAFDDLVWARQLLAASHEPLKEADVVANLDQAIEAGIRDVYCDGSATVADAVRAYDARFRFDEIAALGAVEQRSDGTLRFTGVAALPDDAAPYQRLLFVYLTEPRLAKTLDAPLLKGSLLEAAYERCITPVHETLKACDAVVEACPTSNLVIGGVEAYKHLQLRSLFDNGIAVTINTDDPGVFDVSLEDEFVHVEHGLRTHAAVDRDEWLRRVARQGVELAPNTDATTVIEIQLRLKQHWRDQGWLDPALSVTTGS